MSNVRILSIAILTAISVNVSSQSMAPQKDTGKHGPLPSVMAGLGVIYFNGNIGHGSGITAYSTVRTGYTFGLEYRPVTFLGVQLNGVIGKLASSERSDTPKNNLNFQANFIQGELILNLHLDGLLLKKDAIIAPYIFTGLSYMSYTSYADTRDAKGEPYYYWSDGSIRNEPQNAPDVITAKVIQRSYNYDSLLGSQSTICVPVGLGAKIHITDNICMNIQAAYYFTFSNNIEQYKNLGAAKDKYLFSFCTLEYHFHRKDMGPNGDMQYQSVPDKFFTGDALKDTIKKKDMSKDQEDALAAMLEARTKNLDTNSMSHADVMSMNEGRFVNGTKDQRQHILDSINNLGKNATSTANKKPIPARLQPIDYNHDGFISSDEITRAIDDFFNGTSPCTIEDINAAIDFFFDQ